MVDATWRQSPSSWGDIVCLRSWRSGRNWADRLVPGRRREQPQERGYLLRRVETPSASSRRTQRHRDNQARSPTVSHLRIWPGLLGPRWTAEKRPFVDGSNPAISAGGRELGVLPHRFLRAQVCLHLRPPAPRAAVEHVRMMEQAIQERGTAAVSPKSLPQSSTGRLGVMSVEARS
jgi:hypothetical protein